MAAALGYVDTLRILVDKGADINIKDSKRVSEWEYCWRHISIAVLGGSVTFSVRWLVVPFQMCNMPRLKGQELETFEVGDGCQAMHGL